MFFLKKNLRYFLITFSFANILSLSKDSLKLLDPVSVLVGTAEDLLVSTNVYDQRKANLQKIKSLLETSIIQEEEDDIKKINSIKANLSGKAERFKGSINFEKMNQLLKEINYLVDEKKNQWNVRKDEYRTYLDFWEKNSWFTNEHDATNFVEDFGSRIKFSIEDLNIIEKQISTLTLEKESLIKRNAALVIQISEDEALLESLKKDESYESKKRSSRQNDPLATELAPINEEDGEGLVHSMERTLKTLRIGLLDLKITTASLIINLLNSQTDRIKVRLKELVEQGLRKVKANLSVSLSNVEIEEQVFNHNKKDIGDKITTINNELASVKKDEDTLRQKISDLKLKIKANKHHLSTNTDIDRDALRSELIRDEIAVLKLSQEQEFISAKNTALQVKKKEFNLDLDEKKYNLLRVKACYFACSGNQSGLLDLLNELKDSLFKKYEGISINSASVDDFLTTTSEAKKAEIKENRARIAKMKQGLLLHYKNIAKQAEDALQETEAVLDESIRKYNESQRLIWSFEKRKKNLSEKFESLKKDVNDMIIHQNRYSRSPKAITLDDLDTAVSDFSIFFGKIFWSSKENLNPIRIFKNLVAMNPSTLFGFLMFLLVFLLFALICIAVLKKAIVFFNHAIETNASRLDNKYYFLMLIFITLIYEKFFFVFSWIFLSLALYFNLTIFDFSLYSIGSFYISMFYLFSIFPMWNLVFNLIEIFRAFNQRVNFFFFSEKYVTKNTTLLGTMLYVTLTILSLWLSISNYSPYFNQSILGKIFMAGASLLSIFIFFSFFNKEDILAIIPKYGYITWLIKKGVDTFYYPGLAFFILIFTVINPYVGYVNLGWFLIFAVPASTTVLIGAYNLQLYVKEHMQKFFIVDGDIEGEYIEKFENARIIYGCFVVLSFFFLLISTYALVSRIWFEDYNLMLLWNNINERWVLKLSDKVIGLVQIVNFLAFFFSSFFVSTLIDKLVLKSIFDIFKVDAGLENTISKIFQYTALIISLMLSFIAINLEEFVKYIFLVVAAGILFGMREQIVDIFAGILILLERQIEVGHFVEFEGTRGTIHKISVRSTTIRTMRNFFVSIPNRLLISKPITNWGAGRVAVGMEFNIRVAYGNSPEAICAIIKQIFSENQSVLKVPAVVVRLDEFSEFGMVFMARGFLSARKVREQWDIAAEIRAEIIKVFNTNGIMLAYPHMVVHMAGKEQQSLSTNQSGGDAINIKLNEQVSN